LDPCVYDVFDLESALELNPEVVTLTPGTLYNVTFHIFLCMSWEVRLGESCTEVNVCINILLAFSLCQILGPLLHIQGAVVQTLAHL